MKNRGFTLIEILVVVLIIGMLAAVALPKYKDAIAKSEISGYFPFVKALAQAQEDYYMTNGKYSISLENLAVSVPGSCIYDASSKNNVYCSDSIVIDNQRSYNSSLGKYEPTGRIAVRYCPGIASQGEGICTTASKGGLLSINFFLKHHATRPGEIHCQGWNQKGKDLCKKFSGQMVLD